MNTPAPSRIPSSNADAAALEALDAAFVHVETLDPARNTLWIDASPATQLADDALAKLLTPVLAHVERLGLARTNAGERTLGLLAKAPELTRLDLSGTRVDTPVLAALAGARSSRSWSSRARSSTRRRWTCSRRCTRCERCTRGARASTRRRSSDCTRSAPSSRSTTARTAPPRRSRSNPRCASSRRPPHRRTATRTPRRARHPLPRRARQVALKPVNTTCPVAGAR